MSAEVNYSRQNIRVLHLDSEIAWRGGQQQLAYLIEESSDKGVIDYVVCHEGSSLMEYCQKMAIPHFVLPMSGTFDFSSGKKLKKLIEEFKIDLLHAHTSKGHTLAVYSHLFNGVKTPIVLSRRVMFPISKNWFSSFKYNHKSIKRIIGVSEAVCEEVRKGIKTPSVCVKVYSGIQRKLVIQLDLRKEFKLPEGCKIVGYIGALTEEKNPFIFLETAKSIHYKHPEVKFIMFGEGKLKSQLEQFIKLNGLESAVILTGFMENLKSYISSLDALLFPSLSEGLGSSVLEAFTYKVPVVASNIGGLKEIVIDNVTGVSRPPHDVNGFAEGLEKVLFDPVFRAACIRNSQNLLEDFSKQKMATDTIAIYKEVLQEEES